MSCPSWVAATVATWTSLTYLSSGSGSPTYAALDRCRSGERLLPAVEVVGASGQRGVGHDVYGERRHVCQADHPADGQRVAKLGASVVQLVAEELRGQGSVDEARGDQVDPDRGHLQ